MWWLFSYLELYAETSTDRSWTPTCQSVVDTIVSRPKPQHRWRQRVHLHQTLLRHDLKVLGTRPAAEEAVDVASHGTQHLLGIWKECWSQMIRQKTKSQTPS